MTASILPPILAASLVTRVSSDSRVDPAIRRYAQRRAESVLRRFDGIASVEIVLTNASLDEAKCLLHVCFAGGRPATVGHTAPAMLHAIDTAIETAAHVIAARGRSSVPT